MPRGHFSVRQKVFIGVFAVYLFMAATILGSHYLMERLGGKIAVLEDVGKLEESVLEIRRFEKNFFLYGDPQSLKTALYHLARAQSRIGKTRRPFRGSSVKKGDRCVPGESSRVPKDAYPVFGCIGRGQVSLKR